MTDPRATPVEIRRVDGRELATTSHPLQAYAFSPGPAPPPPPGQPRPERRPEPPPEQRSSHLVAFCDGVPLATATGVPMHQNLRGRVVSMGGVSAVACHPAARRQGYVRALLDALHRELRDAGHVVSTLYPFLSSFYGRFGYARFPQPRTVRLLPDGLDRLLRSGPGRPDGAVTLHRIGEAYDEYRGFCERMLGLRHGFALHPPAWGIGLRDEDKHWLAVARRNGDVVGVMLYRTGANGGELDAKAALWSDVEGRALLLRWLALHVGQFSAFRLRLPPDERPEMWFTDATYVEETTVESPATNPPMGRVLSVTGLAGTPAGAARCTVEVVDDPLIAGRWTLDGTAGVLDVGTAGAGSGTDATLTSHGLAALVYGVLDPAELPLRDWGTVDADAGAALRTLFPPATPYVFAGF